MLARKNFRIRLAACFFAMSSTVHAQNYLEPEDSIFTQYHSRPGYFGQDRYYKDVLTVLRAAFDYGVALRVVVIPSFQNEYALFLKKEGGKYSILSLQSEYHIWRIELLKDYESGDIQARDLDGNDTTQSIIDDLKKGVPDTLDDIPVSQCELVLPNDLGEILERVWASMLYQTRYTKKNSIGFDGVTYHFSGEPHYQRLAGKVWSPDENSRTGKLVTIVETLKTACVLQDASQFSKISAMVSALSAELEGTTD